MDFVDIGKARTVRVAIVGTGNVGASLVMRLMPLRCIEIIQLHSVGRNSAMSAMLDVVSAFPECASKIEIVDRIDSDLVVLTAGLQPDAGSRQSLLDRNRSITLELLNKVVIRQDTVVITIATPVDTITSIVQQSTQLPMAQVVGFGGDLDRNRLFYALNKRKIVSDRCTIIGEHGRNAIPVYSGETMYNEVANEVRTFLSRISKDKPARNLASGELLASMLQSICLDLHKEHCVTCYHPKLEDWFTWPCLVGRKGIVDILSPALGPQSQTAWEELVRQRKDDLSGD